MAKKKNSVKKKTKFPDPLVGILLVMIGMYMMWINAPNYTGIIIFALGIVFTAKPNLVKNLFHNNNKIKNK